MEPKGDEQTGVDKVFSSRTPGLGVVGIPDDQYADGMAAKMWEQYIGNQQQRTGYYKDCLLKVLREHNCMNVFDVACGTGIDSVFLLEEGFKVASCDASDKMLKVALKIRWHRRKEAAFDNWVVEEGNWLNLDECEIKPPPGGFDALICMGNSFAHLPDFEGNNSNQKQAIKNFHNLLKPGGILIIDHRNYDHIVSGAPAPMKNIYYQSDSRVDCKTSVLMVNGKYNLVTLDYTVYPEGTPKEGPTDQVGSNFHLSYYPHLLENFKKLIKGVFGEDAPHTVLADFQPVDQVKTPAYYIHICRKKE